MHKRFNQLPSFYNHLSDYVPEFKENIDMNSEGRLILRSLTKEDRLRFFNFEKLMFAMMNANKSNSS